VLTTSPRTSHLLGLLQVNSNPPKRRSPHKVLAHSPQQELRPGSMRRLTQTCTAQKVSRKVTTESKIWTQVMFRTTRTLSTLRSAQAALCERIRSTTISTTSKSTKTLILVSQSRAITRQNLWWARSSKWNNPVLKLPVSGRFKWPKVTRVQGGAQSKLRSCRFQGLDPLCTDRHSM